MGVTLTERLPELDSFIFNDGVLTSDFLLDEETVHFFHMAQKGGAAKPILTADLAGLGIGRFCIRLVCQLSKASTPERGAVVRYAVMTFPAAKAELLQMSLHVRNGSWPGMKLGEGEMAILLVPTNKWGCPILPLLRPATSGAGGWRRQETVGQGKGQAQQPKTGDGRRAQRGCGQSRRGDRPGGRGSTGSTRQRGAHGTRRTRMRARTSRGCTLPTRATNWTRQRESFACSCTLSSATTECIIVYGLEEIYVF